MAMIDFLKSTKRHFSDGIHLMVDGRNPNAGQLFGFSAECGIKVLLERYGWIARRGDTYFVHIDKLVNIVEAYSTDPSYVSYLALLQSRNTFQSWSIDDRYSDGNFDSVRIIEWHRAAEEVMTMVEKIYLDKGAQFDE